MEYVFDYTIKVTGILKVDAPDEDIARAIAVDTIEANTHDNHFVGSISKGFRYELKPTEEDTM